MDFKSRFLELGLLSDGAKIETVKQEELVMSALGTLLAELTELTDRRIAAAVDGFSVGKEETELFEKLKNLFANPKMPDFNALAELAGQRENVRRGNESRGSAFALLDFLSARGSGVEKESGMWLGMAAYYIYRTYPFVYASLRCRMRVVAPKFNEKNWKEKIKKKLGAKADTAFAVQTETSRNCETEAQKHIDAAFGSAVRIIEEMHEIPDLTPHFARYERLGGCLGYAAYNISKSDMTDALVYGKDLTPLYGSSQLLSDMQRIKEAAKESVRY